MSYTIDTSLTPLYILHFYDHLTLEEAKQLFAEVDELLAHSGKFGVVMTYNSEKDDDADFHEDFDEDLDEDLDDHDDHHHNGHKHRHEPGVARLQKAWIVANRERFAQDCVGMAMVNPDSRFLAFYAPIANKIVSRMYHCPGALFADQDKALAWVQARMPVTT